MEEFLKEVNAVYNRPLTENQVDVLESLYHDHLHGMHVTFDVRDGFLRLYEQRKEICNTAVEKEKSAFVQIVLLLNAIKNVTFRVNGVDKVLVTYYY